MNGVVVINKPVGPSSFEVVKWVSKALQEKKVGHAGTLDPMASGVLVMCLGEATKIIPYLMDTEKEYLATICLGVSTNTDDAASEAKVIFQAEPKAITSLSTQTISEAVFSFLGKQIQRPPQFSALKLQGKRLYELARESQTLEANEQMEDILSQKQREVTIHSMTIEKIELPCVQVRIVCSKGTYIRSIARDLGTKLKVGAHLQALQRLRVGVFSLEQAAIIRMQENTVSFFSPPTLFSMREALFHLPQLQVHAEIALKLRQGQKQALQFLQKSEEGFKNLQALPNTEIVILDEENQVVALIKQEQGTWKINRIFNSSY